MNERIYFSKDKFTLIHGDTFEALKKIGKKSVDFIFSDPPYFLSSGGISCSGGKQVNVNKGEWDAPKDINEKIAFHRKRIKLSKEVLKDDGSIMISSTFHSSYSIGVALELEGFSIINNIVWRKSNPAPNLACRCFTHSTETIIWARKQIDSKHKGKHCFNYEIMKEQNGGKQMKDFWEFDENDVSVITTSTTTKKEKEYGNHPTQKPLKLMKRVIEAATNPNDIILDPFCGSGTTGIAATMLNREFIGIEQNEKYLELAKNRYLGGKDSEEKKL